MGMNDPFELRSTGLPSGTMLLEASAGTGKTFTITGIVLRLLLGVAVPNTQARIAGGVLGAARGVLMLLIIVSLAGLTSFPQKPWWRGSELIVYFQSMAQSLQQMLPADVAGQFRYS